MKKIIALLLVVVLSVGIFSSCGLINGKQPGDNQTNDQTNTPSGDNKPGTPTEGDDPLKGEVIDKTDKNDGQLIWSGNENVSIVVTKETEDITDLFQYLYDLTKLAPKVVRPTEQKVDHEIVIGNIDRPIAVTAYQKLDREVDLFSVQNSGNSAYMIYAEGGSLAVAYTDTVARYVAIEYILTYLKAETLYLDGVVAVKSFNTNEFVKERRLADREDEFLALEEYFGKENTEALRNFYSIYGTDLYLYFANLYDPEIGGFYYSASARDTLGFLPDLESTGQLLGALDRSGLTVGYQKEYINSDFRAWQNMLPEKMKNEILTWAIGLQASDGYFYHPQWATVTTTRKGRDAGWARTVITALGGTPNYPYVSDIPVDEGVSYTGGSSSVMPLGYNPDVDDSTAVLAANEEYASEAAWIAYLDNAFKSGNSYSLFNNLSSRTSEIKKRGLWNATLTWLENNQYENGLWEPTVCYNSVNGLMKISTFWTSERPLPRAEAAVKSTLQVMELDNLDEITGVVFVYNPWVVLRNILPYCGDSEATLRQYITENSSKYINGTFKKLGQFLRDDGGFSYYPTASAHFSQEAYVAVEGTAESDVNATSIAISTLVTYMMPVLLHGTEYQIPPIYGKYDQIYFLDELSDLDGVIKKPYTGPEPEVDTFDEFDPSDGEIANGVTLQPGVAVKINLNSEEVGEDGYYKFFRSSIVSNPIGAAADLVLYMKSVVYDANSDGKVNDDGIECANKDAGSGNAQFDIVNSTIVGNCFVFETDMLFEDYFGSASPTTMQLMYSNGASYNPHNSVWFNFTAGRDADGNPYLLMADNFAGADGAKNSNLIGAIPAGKWIKLRIEMYKIYDAEGALSVKAKIYINDAFAAESDSSNYDTKTESYFDYVVNCIRFSCFRSGGASMYLNNTYAAKEQKDYVAEKIDDGKIDTEVKAPSDYDFEDKVTSGIYSETYNTAKLEEGVERVTQAQTEVDFYTHNGFAYGIAFTLENDPKNAVNAVLKVTSTNASNAVQGRIDVDAAKEEGKRVHILEFDYFFVNNSQATQNLLQLDLLDVNGIKQGGSSTIIYNRTKANDTGKVVSDAARISGSTTGQRLDSRTWYRIRIVIDSDNKAIHYHYSEDNGANWIVAATPGQVSTGATLGTLRLVFNAYNNTGVQYLDDIHYTVSATVPEAKVIESEMAGAKQPTNKVVYDFETGLPTDTTQLKATSYLKPDADSGATMYVAGTEAYNNILTTLGKNGTNKLISGIGTAFYIVDDPTGAANKVLQAVTNNGTGSNGFIDVIGSKLTDNVNTLEITFDYYTDYNNYIAKNLPTMRLMLWDGQYEPDDVAEERRLSFFAYPSETYSYNFTFDEKADEGKETKPMLNSFKIGSHFLNSHTWYTVKVIINGGKQYTYVAERGGDFELIATASYTANLASLKYMRIHIGSYNNNGRQYYDNISYVMTDTFVDPTSK